MGHDARADRRLVDPLARALIVTIARARSGYASADGQFDMHWVRASAGRRDFLYARLEVALHHVEHKPIRRHDPQTRLALGGLQRTYPGIQLLFGQLGFELLQTTIPE